MNIKYHLLILLASLNYATLTHAADIVDTYSWDSGNGSGVYYRVDDKDSLQNFYAKVGHSDSGKQRLYFYEIDSDVFVVPDNVEILKSMNYRFNKSTPSSTTMVFDGQAVKMTRFTETYYDTQKSYHYFTPATEKGHTYLVNLFKKSSSPIKVEYADQILYIPSNGFTRKWNSNGGDAI